MKRHPEAWQLTLRMPAMMSQAVHQSIQAEVVECWPALVVPAQGINISSPASMGTVQALTCFHWLARIRHSGLSGVGGWGAQFLLQLDATIPTGPELLTDRRADRPRQTVPPPPPREYQMDAAEGDQVGLTASRTAQLLWPQSAPTAPCLPLAAPRPPLLLERSRRHPQAMRCSLAVHAGALPAAGPVERAEAAGPPACADCTGLVA